MKLIRKTSLERRQGDNTIRCEITLYEVPGVSGAYLVNLYQGKPGEEGRDSTRTPQPVDMATAETLYAMALVERMAQGFMDPAAHPVTAADAPAPRDASAPPLTPADLAILGRLEAGSWKRLSQQQRNRTLWRIGERRIRQAVPVLVDLIARGDPMQDYCIAWAIGRCGDVGAAIAMHELHRRGSSDAVKRIALQSWLQLADQEALKQHGLSLTDNWPASLREAWATQNAAGFANLYGRTELWTSLSLSDWLEQLDQVAMAYPFARALLLAQLTELPLKAGVFRAVRHIYKAAELRADPELFGLLHHRFETTPDNGTSRHLYIQRQYRAYEDEAARPDSTVAYGQRTRDYLLRRSWRTLRRLGDDQSPEFIDMAMGALLAMNDTDAGKEYVTDGRHYDRYGHWLLFNSMLRSHGAWTSSRSGRSWYQSGAIAQPTGREEAFPALWDARPDALLTLMQSSRCEGVHEFAARALLENTSFCEALSLDVLRTLLRSAYTASARFAFQVARRRFEPGVPDTEWLLLLLQSTLPEAMQYAIDCIARDPVRYSGDAQLVLAVLCSPVQQIRRQGWLLCQGAQAIPGMPEAILLRLLDWLDQSSSIDNAEKVLPAVTADMQWLIETPFRTAAADVSHARLLALATHRLSSVRALACAWLLLHSQPASSIPGALLGALLQDPDLAVRALGVRLFGSLPDQLLAVQADLIAAFCTNTDAGMRAAIDPVMQRVAPGDPAFRTALLPALLDCLFRSETGEGVHADILGWLAGPLADSNELRDAGLITRLLSARAKGAQLAGAQLLPNFVASQFSVADWAAFGRNPVASVRKWAFDAFEQHPEQVRANLEQALRLFDSRFDDSKAFATHFFEQCCGPQDWNALLLVNLCDHLDPVVQRFGRTMITTHFNVADITEFMFKLGQHPSANMQLFVSGWLESACAGDLHKLQRLEPYFLSVLSQVNRGRVVKGRVQAFLRQQATLSEDIAAFVARIFTRQVLTVAIGDKAQYIEGLRAIQERYPTLTDIMTIHAPRRAAA
ncbi:MAG: hypothetical protein ACJ8GW_04865 [Massilia sp.]